MINEKQSVYEVELEFDLKKFNTTFPLLRDFPYLHLSGSDVMLTHPLSFFESKEQVSYVLEMYGEFVQSIIRSLQSKELDGGREYNPLQIRHKNLRRKIYNPYIWNRSMKYKWLDFWDFFHICLQEFLSMFLPAFLALQQADLRDNYQEPVGKEQWK